MKEDRNRLSTRDIANAAAGRHETREDKVPGPEPRAKTEGPPPDAPATADDRAAAAAEKRSDAPKAIDESRHAALFQSQEADGFRSRWEAIQTGFVDEPRTAVQEADALVAQVVARLAEVFSEERTTLEKQWDRGDNISTEDLRIALKRYRAFFDRLLSV
jgi:hypothetical protein